MKRLECAEVELLLSPLIDGDLDERRAEQVREHVSGCASCASVEAEYRGLVAVARQLPVLEPPDALWTRIDAHLDERPRRRWWPFFGLGTLAAVAAAVVLVLSLGPRAPSDEALWRDAQAEFRQAEAHYLRAISDLETYALRERPRWSDEERRRFDEARASLVTATEKCRATAEARPTDPEAQELVFKAYRQQISLLEESVLRRGRR